MYSRRWGWEAGPPLLPRLPSLCLSLVLLPTHSDAACREVGAGCLDPGQHGRPGISGGCLVTRVLHQRRLLPLVASHGLPWGLRTRTWSFGLLVWKLRSGGLVIHGFRCQQERETPSEKPPTCPLNSQGHVRGGKRGRRRVTWGCHGHSY